MSNRLVVIAISEQALGLTVGPNGKKLEERAVFIGKFSGDCVARVEKTRYVENPSSNVTHDDAMGILRANIQQVTSD